MLNEFLFVHESHIYKLVYQNSEIFNPDKMVFDLLVWKDSDWVFDKKLFDIANDLKDMKVEHASVFHPDESMAKMLSYGVAETARQLTNRTFIDFVIILALIPVSIIFKLYWLPLIYLISTIIINWKLFIPRMILRSIRLIRYDSISR